MGERKKVLLLEDHPDIGRMMTLLLRRSGFEVVQALTVREAIDKLDGQAVAVLDLYLPDGSGTEVLKHIRQQSHPTRVAIVSAAADIDIPEEMLLPHDQVFRKPIDLQKLIDWIGPSQGVSA